MSPIPALQIQMFEALGAAPPAFAHEALLVGSEGKLSKRLGSLGVDGDAARRGSSRSRWSPSWRGSAPACRSSRWPTPEPLIAGFDFASFGRAPARFDMDELAALNARIVHQLPFEAVAARLPAGMSAADWAAIRPNLRNVAEAADWWEILHGHVARRGRARRTATSSPRAAEAAAAIDWSDAPWPQLVARLKAERSGKALFQPLRRALTGRDSGPEMAVLLPLIGREEAVARLRAAAGINGIV